MPKNNDLILCGLHVSYVYKQPFDDNRSIVEDCNGVIHCISNEGIVLDKERIFIRKVINWIKQNWE